MSDFIIDNSWGHQFDKLRLENYLEVSEIAAPTTPASGFGRIYEKSDGLLYFKNDAGTEFDLTATGGSPTPAALTKTDDTNVTLTLGGTPATALLQATSLTLGWTGQLALTRGGTGANLSDPGADRILFWDDSAGAVTWLEAGSGLSITGTTLTATGGSDTNFATNNLTATGDRSHDWDTNDFSLFDVANYTITTVGAGATISHILNDNSIVMDGTTDSITITGGADLNLTSPDINVNGDMFVASGSRINLGSNAGALGSPVNGDIFYDSTANRFRGYENSAWVEITEGRDETIKWIAAVGGDLKAQTIGLPLISAANGSQGLADGRLELIPMWLDRPQTLTGVRVCIVAAASGVTADNENRVGLYTITSAGTATLVASSANSATTWTAPSSNSVHSIAFSGTYPAAAGPYYVGLLYNQSAGTACTIAGFTDLGNASRGGTTVYGLPNSVKHTAFIGSQTTLPSSITMSTTTTSIDIMWAGLY